MSRLASVLAVLAATAWIAGCAEPQAPTTLAGTAVPVGAATGEPVLPPTEGAVVEPGYYGYYPYYPYYAYYPGWYPYPWWGTGYASLGFGWWDGCCGRGFRDGGDHFSRFHGGGFHGGFHGGRGGGVPR